MEVLNAKTYDAEEDQLRERTQYSQMDKLLIPTEFQQQPVSTGVRVASTSGLSIPTVRVLDNHHRCRIRRWSHHRC